MSDKLLSIHDYSACSHCKFFDEFGTHGPMAYCKKQHPNVYVSLAEGIPLTFHPKSPTKSIYDIIIEGCSDFEWNGLPVNREIFKKIKQDLPESALLTLNEEALTDLTFSEISKITHSSYGAFFDLKEFEKAK